MVVPRRDDVYAIVIGLAPTALVAILFIIIPVGFSLYLSLWNWPIQWDDRYVCTRGQQT